MRILHVTTLFAATGAFGGPPRVALNQAAGLQDRGHEVIVAAAQQGYGDSPPTEIDGCRVALFPAYQVVPRTKFSGLAAPGLWRWLRRALESTDVAHIHMGRDIVTLTAAHMAQRRGIPTVVQTHGMIDASEHRLAGPLDRVFTRPILRRAAKVLYLNETERRELEKVITPPPALQALGNGVPMTDQPVTPFPERKEFVFVSRLHERKRPMLFVRMARQLLNEGFDANFVLVGPDGGQGAAVAAAVDAVGDPDRLRWEGPMPPSETLARMARSTMLILPSINEPWAMVVLEALSVGRPVLVTESCGVANVVREQGCGIVIDEAYESLVNAVRDVLTDPTRVDRMASHARQVARDQFSMDAVVDRLEAIYTAAMA